jgi:hypothetical protein
MSAMPRMATKNSSAARPRCGPSSSPHIRARDRAAGRRPERAAVAPRARQQVELAAAQRHQSSGRREQLTSADVDPPANEFQYPAAPLGAIRAAPVRRSPARTRVQPIDVREHGGRKRGGEHCSYRTPPRHDRRSARRSLDALQAAGRAASRLRDRPPRPALSRRVR